MRRRKDDVSSRLISVVGGDHPFPSSQQDLHGYEKEHRYSNEEYFEREQRMKSIESELSMMITNNEKLQREYSLLNEELTKCRYDLEQAEKSDLSHKDHVSCRPGKIINNTFNSFSWCNRLMKRKSTNES